MTGYAFGRNSDGKLRLHINGKPMPLKNQPVDKAPLDYGKLEFAYGGNAPLIIDIDEVCLFDRDLTDDEIKRLAGLAEK